MTNNVFIVETLYVILDISHLLYCIVIDLHFYFPVVLKNYN